MPNTMNNNNSNEKSKGKLSERDERVQEKMASFKNLFTQLIIWD